MIKVICGVVGHYIGGRVIPKDASNEPFALDPALEAQLVAAGRAEYVEGTVTPPQAPAAPVGDAEPSAGDVLPPSLDDMNANELRAYGKTLGLIFKVGLTKEAMKAYIVERLDALSAQAAPEADPEDDDAEDTDDATDIDVGDNEDAPGFDASDMVVL